MLDKDLLKVLRALAQGNTVVAHNLLDVLDAAEVKRDKVHREGLDKFMKSGEEGGRVHGAAKKVSAGDDGAGDDKARE